MTNSNTQGYTDMNYLGLLRYRLGAPHMRKWTERGVSQILESSRSPCRHEAPGTKRKQGRLASRDPT